MTTPTDTVQIIRPTAMSATAVRITGDTAHAALGVAAPQVLPVLQVIGPDGGAALNLALDGGRLEPLIDT